MEIRCPNCRESLPLSEDTSEIICSSCGHSISLLGDETAPYDGEVDKMIDHFRLIRVLGKGSFGTVWQAHDEKLDRVVALKIPHRDTHHPVPNTVLREARAASQLKHPNIVTVHEVGLLENTLFIVTDYIDGMSLSDKLTISMFSFHEIVDLCAATAEALQHAHQAGVVHRDLKPSNVLLDSEGRPHLVDFGLAKRESAQEITLTRDGQIMGTPAYMSPEQALGDSHDADARSDVYSLGVIMFQLLTRNLPFRGNTRMLLNQVITEEPPRPRSLNENIPLDLETICLKCLEKDPRRRYATARELLEDLNRYRNGEPIHARPITRGDRVVKWARRNPLIAGLSATVLAVSIVGFVSVTWQWRQSIAAHQRTARTQVDALLTARPEAVQSIIDSFADGREWIDPVIRANLESPGLSPHFQTRLNLGLLPVQPSCVSFLSALILHPDDLLDPAELLIVGQALYPHRQSLIDKCWEAVENEDGLDAHRFRCALLLALFDSGESVQTSERWAQAAPFVATQLVRTVNRDPGRYALFVNAFESVKSALSPMILTTANNSKLDQNLRGTAISVFADYTADDPESLVAVLVESVGSRYEKLFSKLPNVKGEALELLLDVLNAEDPQDEYDEDAKDALARRRVAAAIALWRLDGVPDIWWMLRRGRDPRARSYGIDRLASLGVSIKDAYGRLAQATDPSTRQAVVLALGEYDSGTVAKQRMGQMAKDLKERYRKDPDPGVHCAIQWTLERFGYASDVKRMDSELVSAGPIGGRRWYCNSLGITMVVFESPPPFMMGSKQKDPMHKRGEKYHSRTIGRSYAMAATEVTVAQFNKYASEVGVAPKKGPGNLPAYNVSYFRAMEFCRWLSEKEGFPPDEMCYPSLVEIHRTTLSLKPDLVKRTSYRLPTEGEWEYACRLDTRTPRFFGCCDDLLPKYAWYADVRSTAGESQPVALLKPNDSGLFDIYGNLFEWCQDYYDNYPDCEAGETVIDEPVLEGREAVLRGGAFDHKSSSCRSAARNRNPPSHDRSRQVGFRIAQTIAPE